MLREFYIILLLLLLLDLILTLSTYKKVYIIQSFALSQINALVSNVKAFLSLNNSEDFLLLNEYYVSIKLKSQAIYLLVRLTIIKTLLLIGLNHRLVRS